MKMKRNYENPQARVEEFVANAYTASCYQIGCSVGDGKLNPVTNTVWAINEGTGISHSSSGTGNCHDSGSNYLTTDANGKLVALKEWRSDMNKYLDGENISWTDLNGNGIADAGDYFSWNTVATTTTTNNNGGFGGPGGPGQGGSSTTTTTRTWHHWGIAQKGNRS